MFASLFHSYLLAQIFGLYLIIMAVIMAGRYTFYREVIRRMDPYNPAISFTSSLGFLLGLFLLVIHNDWVWEPRVVITVIAWLISIKSVLWLSFPVRMLSVSKKIYGGSGYFFITFVCFAAGVFLLTKGFYLFIPPEHIDVPFVEAF